jgi:hypothetical protein
MNSKVTMSVAPLNVLAIDVASTNFAGRSFIGFDSERNEFWRTEMGVLGGIMRQTSRDGEHFNGKSTRGGKWEPARSVLTPVQSDGSSKDTEAITYNGITTTVVSRCTR